MRSTVASRVRWKRGAGTTSKAPTTKRNFERDIIEAVGGEGGVGTYDQCTGSFRFPLRYGSAGSR
jgi:hypothetical protein